MDLHVDEADITLSSRDAESLSLREAVRAGDVQGLWIIQWWWFRICGHAQRLVWRLDGVGLVQLTA